MSFEDELRESLKRAEAQMPPAHIDLHETMVGARRGLMLRYALSTVAIAVAIGGGAVVANDLMSDDAPAPEPAAPTPAPDTGVGEREESRRAVAAARAWVRAMGAGDRRRAWRLMTSRARARYPAFGQFASDSGLSEGWARWAFADNVAYYAHPVDPEGREAVVVTIAGTRQAEGATESAAASMVVDIGKKRALVDPLTGGTSIVPVGELGAGGAFNAGEPLSLEARVPKSARDVYFLVSPRPRSADAVQGASFDASHMLVQQRLDPLPAGDYWVTIAAFGPDGDTWTRSVEFRVE